MFTAYTVQTFANAFRSLGSLNDKSVVIRVPQFFMYSNLTLYLPNLPRQFPAAKRNCTYLR